MNHGSPTTADEPATDTATVLADARERVRTLATNDGGFHVACVRTGRCPEPVTDATFATYEDAAAAAAAARRYCNALRELDPKLPTYDLAVYRTREDSVQVTASRERTAEVRANGLPRSRRVATVAGARDGEWLRMENAPVVFLSRDAELIDDETIERQLDTKL